MSSSRSPSKLHEHLAEHAGEACACGSPPDWVDHQATGGSHRVLVRPGFPDFAFAFHDNEEIGPRMLARIAKHTGLKPEDLRTPASRRVHKAESATAAGRTA